MVNKKKQLRNAIIAMQKAIIDLQKKGDVTFLQKIFPNKV